MSALPTPVNSLAIHKENTPLFAFFVFQYVKELVGYF